MSSSNDVDLIVSLSLFFACRDVFPRHPSTTPVATTYARPLPNQLALRRAKLLRMIYKPVLLHQAARDHPCSPGFQQRRIHRQSVFATTPLLPVRATVFFPHHD